MNTDARRRASAAFHAKREAEGYRKVTVWMAPDTREELDRLAKVYGSREKAIASAINHHRDEARRRGKAMTNEPAKITERLHMAEAATASVHVAVPMMERKPFNPQPKTGKAKR